MSLGVWLEVERKCFATVAGLDSLLFKNALVFIKSVLFFLSSAMVVIEWYERVQRMRQFSCVVLASRSTVGQHSFFYTV